MHNQSHTIQFIGYIICICIAYREIQWRKNFHHLSWICKKKYYILWLKNKIWVLARVRGKFKFEIFISFLNILTNTNTISLSVYRVEKGEFQFQRIKFKF